MERQGQDRVALEVPEPEPAAGDAVLAVAAGDVDARDDLVRRSWFPAARRPLVVGDEGVGTVVGAGSTDVVGSRWRFTSGAIDPLQDRPSGKVVSVP